MTCLISPPTLPEIFDWNGEEYLRGAKENSLLTYDAFWTFLGQ
jgi:hypothetical protein